MMLVGDVADRVTILIDDMADTANTITRAARLLKKEGATAVYALITHGILSGEAIERINRSDIDRVVVTNSVPQKEHERQCSKLRVLQLGYIFSEASFDAIKPGSHQSNHGSRLSVVFIMANQSLPSLPMINAWYWHQAELHEYWLSMFSTFQDSGHGGFRSSHLEYKGMSA